MFQWIKNLFKTNEPEPVVLPTYPISHVTGKPVEPIRKRAVPRGAARPTPRRRSTSGRMSDETYNDQSLLMQSALLNYSSHSQGTSDCAPSHTYSSHDSGSSYSSYDSGSSYSDSGSSGCDSGGGGGGD